MMQGTLIQGIGSFYTAATPEGEHYTLRCKKRFRRLGLSPLVGDEVLFSPGEGEEDGWLEEILPRSSVFVRPPVANVSLMLITVAPVPEPDWMLVERLLVIARRQGLRCLLLASKCDLDSGLAGKLEREYAGAEAPVYAASAVTGEGIDALREAMRGETCCLCGQSGVGKSSLLGRMLSLDLETGEISRKIQRGRNTTRKAELLLSGGLRVLDTAGFSLLELDTLMPPEELRAYYPEFLPHEGLCRFNPCLHDREPGCAVAAAADAGQIDPSRLGRYRTLLGEVRQAWKERYD